MLLSIDLCAMKTHMWRLQKQRRQCRFIYSIVTPLESRSANKLWSFSSKRNVTLHMFRNGKGSPLSVHLGVYVGVWDARPKQLGLGTECVNMYVFWNHLPPIISLSPRQRTAVKIERKSIAHTACVDPLTVHTHEDQHRNPFHSFHPPISHSLWLDFFPTDPHLLYCYCIVKVTSRLLPDSSTFCCPQSHETPVEPFIQGQPHFLSNRLFSNA